MPGDLHTHDADGEARLTAVAAIPNSAARRDAQIRFLSEGTAPLIRARMPATAVGLDHALPHVGANGMS